MEKTLRKIFEWSLLVKSFNGAWEVVSGFLVLFVSKQTFDRLFQYLARKELLEDPHDLLMNFLSHALTGFTGNAKVFAALYILLHGALNIFLAVQLHRNRHWAYLVAIAAMLSIMVYQIYRIVLYGSLFLTGLTIFDAFFVVLTWHEYRQIKAGAVNY